jgi:hypothetical protein
VHDAIRLVFDVFERRGSVHGVMRYLVDHDIALPDRARNGPLTGDVVWQRPHRSAILGMLTSPVYAGAYVFGRRRGALNHPGRRSGACQPSRNPEDWQVLLRDRWPAYITWETYEENQRRLMANRSKHKGVPRGGPSLLAGVLYCGRCGSRMVTCYRNNGRDLRYECTRHQINYGAPHCQALAGPALDALSRSEDEFIVAEIAAHLNMPEGTIYSWLYKQRLPARRVEAAERSLWLVQLKEVQQLLGQRGAGGRLPPRQPS